MSHVSQHTTDKWQQKQSRFPGELTRTNKVMKVWFSARQIDEQFVTDLFKLSKNVIFSELFEIV